MEKAPVSVIQGEADQQGVQWTACLPDGIAGVSIRRVDELVQATRMSGISKSSVSKPVPRTSTSG